MNASHSPAPLLATEQLSVNFGALNVVQSVSFRLEKGARHALIGPNGAGKTTFINLLSGALRPSRGSIYIAGSDVGGLSVERRVRHGLVRTFQISQLFRSLTVFENVSLAVMNRRGAGMSILRRCISYEDVTQEAIDTIERLGLGDVAFQSVSDLAYGTQRLVELAIALGMRPKILLLDEPMAGIPVGERGPILDVISSLDRDLAILIVEHDIDFVFQFAREITVLANGSILANGAPADIIANKEVMEIYLGGGSDA